jgi:hypothetical protein
MTCELTNRTPLPAAVRAHRDHLGQPHILVVAKGTWRLSDGRLGAAEQQVGLHEKQICMRLGDFALDSLQKKVIESRQEEQIVWLDYDLSPPKPAFDVIVAGYATAPPNYQEAHIDAGVRIGQHVASLRAHVPRYWEPGLLNDRAKPLTTAVTRVPITYAFADWSLGFPLDPSKDALAWLPWIEAPCASNQRGKRAKAPVGFGIWPENSAHRQPHAGTYDDVWKRERSPDLPKDFDARFYNVAHPDLQLPNAPVGGTAIRLVHLAEKAVIDTHFPTLSLSAQATTAGGQTTSVVTLKPDTLIIEPDHDRMSVVWRVLLSTGAERAALRSVRLFKSEKQAA